MVQATSPRSFDTSQPIEAGLTVSPSEAVPAPRIYYVPLSLVANPEQWPAILDGAAGMGFDTVLISPPTEPGPTGNLLLPYGFERAHPALGHELEGSVAGLVRQARERNLVVMSDLVVDRVAADGPLLHDIGLMVGRGADALDPRVPPTSRKSATVPYAAGDSRAADRFTGYVATLARAGVTGFRCLSPAAVPTEIWAKLKDAAPGARFLAWMPGVPSEAVATLTQAGFDGAFSSLRWWDCRAAWPVDDHERLRSFGGAIAFPEAPFDVRLAQSLDSDRITGRRSERALWVAATLGDGLMIPMGFEYGAREPVPAVGAARETFAVLKGHPHFDLGPAVRAANAFVAREGGRFRAAEMRLLTGGNAPLTAVLRTSGATGARLVVVNPSLDHPDALAAAAFASEVGQHLPFHDVLGSGPALGPEGSLRLRPAEVRVLEGSAGKPVTLSAEVLGLSEAKAIEAPRFIIDTVTPSVDDGLFPAKRIVGEVVRVEADAFAEGHDVMAVALKWRAADEEAWQERRMRHLGNDRWAADMPLNRLGRHEFTVEAWRDEFGVFLYELTKKHEAGLNVGLELEEGRLLVERVAKAGGSNADRLQAIVDRLNGADDPTRLAVLMAPETAETWTEADPRPFRLVTQSFPIDAERQAAGFASWYELFPRSMSNDVSRHGTFEDVIGRLPYVRAMGFDVLYFPPIHPIGRTNRKGRNNTLTPGPDDPGSPYAIGAPEGGHDAIHPELGDFDSLERLRLAAAEHGLELALDFAIQASPDHPWLKEHPEWFDWRPDGSIRYAENPPKKYEDIVNVDFFKEGAKPSLWVTLRDTLLFWVEKGIKLFRIDNPHTKPFPFWEWCISDIRREHPDVVFLAEAFTRPKVTYRLAKVGYSQSYTYFTWRNTKQELTEYLTELSTTAPKDFFRPHFFVNTPDINPDFLQDAPRQSFLIRAALATMLSGLWGMYSGFELCEGRPDAKRKEYADSEKYQLTAWDWDRPGNIIGEIGQLNRIRRDNPALHSHLGVTFRPAYNDNILLFTKQTATRDNVLLIAINLDPYNAQEADIELPLWEFGLHDGASITAEDLMNGARFAWSGKYQRIRLDPYGGLPFSIWRLGATRGA